MNPFWSGLALVVAAGAMGGSFTVPLKYVRGWAWEKTWLFYSIVGMVLVPWLIVAWAIPNPGSVFFSVGTKDLVTTALFGAGWGIGSVLFGLGVTRVGTALAFAIVVSMTATLGSLIPLAVLQPNDLQSARTLWLLLGLAIVLVGLTLCARAGFLKEAAQKGPHENSAAGEKGGAAASSGFLGGLLICLVAGITSPMFNFSVAFGGNIQREAEHRGAEAAIASVAVIAVTVSAGFLTNALYCLYLLRRNRTLRSETGAPALRNTALVVLMGLLWMLGMFFYGVGASRMGDRGPVLGWPLFMTLMVLMGNFWGTLTGEWKGSGRRAYLLLQLGNIAMVAAFIVISVGTRPS
ncbi:MAG TPA: L-rhamnose/proton symporter RhaT [Planctomycetaceae bacterium]|jgi:L-rhamnose-H+ transport protein|nr:L-rhamnose/proton symporter RhaT [Planctomycetaceae bacterium]